MSTTASTRKPVTDWPTAISIAAVAISLTVALHEGVHALTCLGVGSDLLEYSALYTSCDSSTTLQAKLVAGSAPAYNLLAGVLLWLALRTVRRAASETRFFLWLFMLMNLCYGTGYLMFSGVANVGDLAVVIDGWQPGWLWRVLMTAVGTASFIAFVWVALRELGRMIGGEGDEQIRRANRLCLVSYVTSFVVVLLAGLFCPYGLLSLPVTAGISAVLGALSPLLWMVRWFRAASFPKAARPPLEIRRRWGWMAGAAVVVSSYVLILGRTLYF